MEIEKFQKQRKQNEKNLLLQVRGFQYDPSKNLLLQIRPRDWGEDVEGKRKKVHVIETVQKRLPEGSFIRVILANVQAALEKRRQRKNNLLLKVRKIKPDPRKNLLLKIRARDYGDEDTSSSLKR